MDVEYFRTLYDYCYWARDRVLGAMEGMSEAEYAKPNGFVYGSIRGILTHALWAEEAWLARWRGETPSWPGSEAEVPTPAALAARWQQHEASMRAFLAGLSESDLAREITLRRRDGSEASWLLWQLLAHVANHATQHRSEAAAALTMVGRSPGEVDFIFYLRERPT